jgi:transcriptional regulator of NAD metabolism
MKATESLQNDQSTATADALRRAVDTTPRVTEVTGSHAVYVSKPREVAEIIEKAAASSS